MHIGLHAAALQFACEPASDVSVGAGMADKDPHEEKSSIEKLMNPWTTNLSSDEAVPARSSTLNRLVPCRKSSDPHSSIVATEKAQVNWSSTHLILPILSRLHRRAAGLRRGSSPRRWRARWARCCWPAPTATCRANRGANRQGGRA